LALASAGVALGRAGGLLAAFGAAGYLMAAVTTGLDAAAPPPLAAPLEARVVVASPWVIEARHERGRARASLLYWRVGEAGHRGGTDLLLDAPADAELPEVGSVVRVRGELRGSQVFRNRGDVETGGLRLVVKAGRWMSTERRPTRWQRIANRARAEIDRLLPPAAPGSAPGTALARALVLGDGSGLSTETWRGLRQTGLAHLAAVSGFNVAVLVATVWVLAQLFGVVGFWRHALSGGAALAYLAVLGEQPSAARATAMAACVALGFAVKALPWAFQLLGWAAVGLLLFEPAWLLDLSFQLTFAATIGLLVGTPAVSKRLRDRGIPGWLATPVAATISAQVATAPWALIRFHSLVGFGVLWNLLAAPWSVVAFLASFLSLPALAWGGGLARQTRAFLDLWATPLTWLRDSTPIWATRSWCADPVLAWGGAACLAWALWSGSNRRRSKWALGLAGLAAWTLPLMLPTVRQSAPRVISFDVGQGDATLFEGGGGRVLVDGGGWEVGDFGGRVLVPALAAEGVHRLDAVVLSHFDRDHCRGLLDLTSFLAVQDVWTGPGWEASECGRALRGRARRRSGTLMAGDSRRYGAWSFNVVAPDLRDLGRWRLQSNDSSVVLLAEAAGRRVLLLGDLQSEGERWLAFRRTGELYADVLKVGHHGSATSTTNRLLDVVRPRVAIVSAGADNPFGHPAPVVLQRLRDRRILALGTHSLGQIVLEQSGSRGFRISLPGPITIREGASR
jgi:competence protein ComEC